MKKIVQIICILGLLIPYIYIPDMKVKAKTLGDLLKELEQQKAELEQNKQQKAETEQEIKDAQAGITRAKNQIEKIYKDLMDLNTEIELLNESIAKKEQEMKDIINFVQVSNGESAYMEYAFGAKDFTDFIYRMAVSEQLTNYNEQLIEQFNQDIEESKRKQEELKKKQADLAEQQKELESKAALLGEELKNIEAVAVDLEDMLDYQKEIIQVYIDKGCKENEDIKTCGRALLPPGTSFYRPTETGRITSEWGPRDFAGRNWHEGIDVGVAEGTPVYAVANGLVSLIMYQYKCGGNMVVVHHNINGKTYTTVYAHLLSISVRSGDTVNRNTLIGYSGGYSTSAYYSGSYDQCSYGAHLHLTVATGLFGKGFDYDNWTYELNYKYSINPRGVINFPGMYTYWYDRLTAF